MKKLISILLVFALCMSLGFNAFAASTSQSGSTKPGGSGGILNVEATLYADKYTATAKTNVTNAASGYTVSTTIIYYFINQSFQSESVSKSGAGSVTVGNANQNGTRATSQHAVRGGSVWGSWSGNLSVNVW